MACGLNVARNVVLAARSSPTPSRIAVALSCPLCPARAAVCQERMEHPALEEVLRPRVELMEQVRSLAMRRLRDFKRDKADDIVKPGGRFRNTKSPGCSFAPFVVRLELSGYLVVDLPQVFCAGLHAA